MVAPGRKGGFLGEGGEAGADVGAGGGGVGGGIRFLWPRGWGRGGGGGLICRWGEGVSGGGEREEGRDGRGKGGDVPSCSAADANSLACFDE
jgi:hypothetical protein